ncbi:VWA domain-containing protein [Stackebrandtia nassauensis]|uniref:VWA domain-containing protein n=1 Tax=Stackebrandtia nassauensis TaxID=283811 RepID=UPI0001A3872F|nr:substrate-binding domain-containing protein [Stackebrandtia nassauensis]
MTTVVALAASGLVGGYAFLLSTGCSGDPIKAVVAAPKEISGTLQTAARSWAGTEPSVDGGQCISVEVREQASQDVVSALSGSSTGSKKDLPHVWIPESMAWLEMAKISDRGKKMLPDSPPLVATSPTVIAMPTEAAKALGWRNEDKPVDKAGKPTWGNLLKLAEDSDWSQFGKDKWGDITVGMSDPMASTADLHALLSIVDKNRSAGVDAEELGNVSKLKSTVHKETPSVEEMMGKVSEAKAKGDPVGFVSAFPALERDVWKNNFSGTESPLTAVYPADGSLDADYPLAVLQNVSWTDATHQEIGKQFGEYLLGEGQKEIKKGGFRDGTRREASSELTGTEGLATQITATQRDKVDSESVQTTLATWQAVARPANVLVVVDSSSSMSTEEPYDGEKLSRMDIIRKSLERSLDLFGEQANVGLWRYPYDDPVAGTAYQKLVEIGEFDKSRQDDIESQLSAVEPAADGGLNDTVVEAYKNVLDNYNKTTGAINLVVVISDGGSESDASLSNEDVTEELKDLSAKDRDKEASIMTIGYGKDADKDHLDAIATATQGRYYPAKWNDEINMQILNALYYN